MHTLVQKALHIELAGQEEIMSFSVLCCIHLKKQHILKHQNTHKKKKKLKNLFFFQQPP